MEVTHFVRPDKAGLFPGGVRLDLLEERKSHPAKAIHPYPIRCVESITPADGYELVIVPTSGYQVAPALEALAPLSGDATFLVFSGNWDGLAAYKKRNISLSRSRTLPVNSGWMYPTLLQWGHT